MQGSRSVIRYANQLDSGRRFGRPRGCCPSACCSRCGQSCRSKVVHSFYRNATGAGSFPVTVLGC